MKPKNLKELETIVISAETTPVSEDTLAETGIIWTLVSSLEQALTWYAARPRMGALILARRVLRLLSDIELYVSDNLSAVRHALYWKSRLYQAMTKRDQAYKAAKRYTELCPENASLLHRAETLIFMAKVCYWSDDQQGAVRFQREAIDFLEQAREKGKLTDKNQRRFNTAYTVWAFRYAQNTCCWKKAYKTFKKAHEQARAWGDPGILTATLVLYSETKMFQGDWEGCERLARECVEAALSQPEGPQSDYPFWIWGRALVHTGNPEQAVPELEKSIKIAKEIGDTVGLSEALVSRAEAHLTMGENEKAVKTAAQAQRVATYAKLGINLAQVRVWRAWIEMETDPDCAVKHLGPLHQSLADFERIGCLSGWACALGALGHALGLAGKANESRFYLEGALKAFKKWDMPWHSVRTENSIARFSNSK